MFRNQKVVKIIIGCIIVVCIYVAFYGIRSLSYFEVSDIHFTGTKYVAKKALVSSVGVEFKKNIFDIDLKSVEERLSNNPWFESVSVSRKLPSTVSVVVQERKPSFVLVSGGSYYFVAGDGMVLSSVTRVVKGNYLLISGINKDDSRPGRKLFEKYPELRTIVYTLAHKNLIINCKEIRFTKSKGWVLFFGQSSYPIFLGKFNMRGSLDNFLRAKKKIEKDNVTLKYVDCRFKNMAVIAKNKSL